MQQNKNAFWIILVAALGYFVDIYDLLLFSIERIDSLKEILGTEATDANVKSIGIDLLNWQMGGMVAGGLFWGILGDKKGRLSVLFGSILVYSLANIANGFVQTVEQYALLRFISGFGLAGELGAGITLVSESMSRERRGIGTMIVATVGVSGAIVAGLVGNFIENWRNSFFIGGVMGLVLLVMRIGVFESGMYNHIRNTAVKKGNFFKLFSTRKNIYKYVGIIVIAAPVWYVMSILVTFSPEMMKSMGVTSFIPLPSKSIMWAYVGITVGDLASGTLSQYLKSRKKVLLYFLLMTIVSIFLYFKVAPQSETLFYIVIFIIGFATGYWAVFMSTAAELFGTNIRATVTTTAPNFVRGAVIFFTLGYKFAEHYMSSVQAAIFVGFVVFILAFVSLYLMEETYGKDLDYSEE